MDAVLNIVSRPPPPPVAAKKSSRSVPGMVVALLIGAACGFLGMRYGWELMLPVPGPKLLKLITVAALPFSWLMAVGIHELGHLVGGWIVGGRFLLWVVGPVMVRRTPRGIRLGGNGSVNLFGGLGACLPSDPTRMTPRRAAIMILGGPFASGVLVVGALWLAAELAAGTEPVSAARALAQHVALCSAAMSLGIFLLAAIPSASSGFKSDGKRVFDLVRGDRRSEQEAALLVLTTANLAGIRPADYDRTLVARVLSLGDGSLFDRYGHFAVFYHAADRGDWSAAQWHLDYVLAGEDQVASYMRDMLRCEYSWLLAGPARDAINARAWLETAGKLEFDPATRLRAEAAVLLAEGKAAEAAAKARDGLHALDHRSLSPVRPPFAAGALEAILRQATDRLTLHPALHLQA